MLVGLVSNARCHVYTRLVAYLLEVEVLSLLGLRLPQFRVQLQIGLQLMLVVVGEVLVVVVVDVLAVSMPVVLSLVSVLDLVVWYLLPEPSARPSPAAVTVLEV